MHPVLAAPVSGPAAAVLVPVLDQRLELLQQLAAGGRLDPSAVTEARQMFDLIRQAAREYVTGSAGGTAEPVLAELPQRSLHEISSDEAAEALGVSASMVRRLLRRELLAGRKAGRTWFVERASVLAYRDLRGE